MAPAPPPHAVITPAEVESVEAAAPAATVPLEKEEKKKKGPRIKPWTTTTPTSLPAGAANARQQQRQQQHLIPVTNTTTPNNNSSSSSSNEQTTTTHHHSIANQPTTRPRQATTRTTQEKKQRLHQQNTQQDNKQTDADQVLLLHQPNQAATLEAAAATRKTTSTAPANMQNQSVVPKQEQLQQQQQQRQSSSSTTAAAADHTQQHRSSRHSRERLSAATSALLTRTHSGTAAAPVKHSSGPKAAITAAATPPPGTAPGEALSTLPGLPASLPQQKIQQATKTRTTSSSSSALTALPPPEPVQEEDGHRGETDLAVMGIAHGAAHAAEQMMRMEMYSPAPAIDGHTAAVLVTATPRGGAGTAAVETETPPLPPGAGRGNEMLLLQQHHQQRLRHSSRKGQTGILPRSSFGTRVSLFGRRALNRITAVRDTARERRVLAQCGLVRWCDAPTELLCFSKSLVEAAVTPSRSLSSFSSSPNTAGDAFTKARNFLMRNYEGKFLVIDASVIRRWGGDANLFQTSYVELPRDCAVDVLVDAGRAASRWWVAQNDRQGSSDGDSGGGIVVLCCEGASVLAMASWILLKSGRYKSAELAARACSAPYAKTVDVCSLHEMQSKARSASVGGSGVFSRVFGGGSGGKKTGDLVASQLLMLKQLTGAMDVDPSFPVPSVTLTELTIRCLPAFDRRGTRLLVIIMQGVSFLYSSMQQGDGLAWIPCTEGCQTVSVVIPMNVTFRGGITVKAYHVPPHVTTDNPKQRIFSIDYHSGFAAMYMHEATYRRDVIDGAGSYEPHFRVTMRTREEKAAAEDAGTEPIPGGESSGTVHAAIKRGSRMQVRSERPREQKGLSTPPPLPERPPHLAVSPRTHVPVVPPSDEQGNRSPTRESAVSTASSRASILMELSDAMLARQLQDEYDRELNQYNALGEVLDPTGDETALTSVAERDLDGASIRAMLADLEAQVAERRGEGHSRPSRFRAASSDGTSSRLRRRGMGRDFLRGMDRMTSHRDGASIAVISMLPEFKCDQGSSYLSEECQVCKSLFEAGDVLRALPCMHSFHRDCVDHWLQQKSKCPICWSDLSLD